MPTAILIHGTSGSPQKFWFPWLRKQFDSIGYQVETPLLPNPDLPSLEDCLPFLEENFTLNDETILVGHSSACPLILTWLQNSKRRIHKAVLVAGFYQEIDAEGISRKILPESYHYELLRSLCSSYIFINSDNDPWGCNDAQARSLAEGTGGNLVVPFGLGHMGSDSYNQLIPEFPLLWSLARPS